MWGGEKEILDKFSKFGAQLVFSTEKFCWPPHLLDLQRPAPTLYRYLNAGGYIGYAGFIKYLLQDMLPYADCCCDQASLMAYLLGKNPDLIDRGLVAFDYFNTIFLSLQDVDEKELKLDLRNRRIYCKATKSYPCIIHGNGGGKVLFPKLYDKLFSPR
jgi:hypothetical protein